MARNLPYFTRCAGPGLAFAWTEGGNWVGTIIYGFVFGITGITIAGLVFEIISGAMMLGCAIGTGVYIMLATMVADFKHWYYNRRLMCIKHDQCACGTVVGEPHDAFDGDRKLDVLVAPFGVRDTEQLLITLLDERRGVLSNVPDLIDLQNRQVLLGYVRGLSNAQQRELYIRLADEKMFTTPANSFQRHYYRRDQAIMGDPAFLASPDDTLAAESPNPVCRINHVEGGDPEEGVLVPWMHCEVEGNRVERILDNVLAAVIAGLVAFVAACVVCETITVGAGDWLCGLIAGGISLLIAFLIWLISQWINDPDDGVAGEIDVDVEDASFDTPPSEARRGDVVYLFGDWVMDMEHDKYFEIHPVKAYYLLCRSAQMPEDWEITEEVPAAECEFDVRELTGADMERICRIVQAVEHTDPDESFTTDVSHALAMMPGPD